MDEIGLIQDDEGIKVVPNFIETELENVGGAWMHYNLKISFPKNGSLMDLLKQYFSPLNEARDTLMLWRGVSLYFDGIPKKMIEYDEEVIVSFSFAAIRELKALEIAKLRVNTKWL